VHYQNITRLLGQSIPPVTIKKILSSLEIAVLHEETDALGVLVPHYRLDVRREVDVIEEIARIYGYDKIAVTGRLGSTYLAKTHQPAPNKLRHEASTLLAANGYHEIYTNSLTKSSYAALTDTLDAQQNVAIANPLSEVLDVLRQTLLFSGLEVLAHNINRKQPDLKLFELGKIYRKEGAAYVENSRLALFLTGNIEAINWIRKPKEVCFQDLHAIIDQLLHHLNLTTLVRQPIKNTLFQAGIVISQANKVLLTAGEVAPPLLTQMGIHQSVFFADINWEAVLSLAQPPAQYQPIPKFPPVKRDLSLVLNKSVTFEEIKQVIAAQNNKLIEDVAVFDVYEGEGLAEDKKAYALRFVLQGSDKTLDEKTIDRVMVRLMRAFETQLGAVIRA
jgi:phenylalanyl-tRNA synthetase beta chain